MGRRDTNRAGCLITHLLIFLGKEIIFWEGEGERQHLPMFLQKQKEDWGFWRYPRTPALELARLLLLEDLWPGYHRLLLDDQTWLLRPSRRRWR